MPRSKKRKIDQVEPNFDKLKTDAANTRKARNQRRNRNKAENKRARKLKEEPDKIKAGGTVNEKALKQRQEEIEKELCNIQKAKTRRGGEQKVKQSAGEAECMEETERYPSNIRGKKVLIHEIRWS